MTPTATEFAGKRIAAAQGRAILFLADGAHRFLQPDDYRMIPQLSRTAALTLRGECATSLLLCLRLPCVRSDSPRSPRSREHPHFSRSRRGSGAAGDFVFGRQGQRGYAASGEEGFFSVVAAVSVAACRYHMEIPRYVRAARQSGA